MRKYLKIKKVFFPYDIKEGNIPSKKTFEKN